MNSDFYVFIDYWNAGMHLCSFLTEVYEM